MMHYKNNLFLITDQIIKITQNNGTTIHQPKLNRSQTLLPKISRIPLHKIQPLKLINFHLITRNTAQRRNIAKL